MSTAYVSTTVDAPVAAVWAVLGEFHGIAGWVGRIRSAEPGNGAANAVGSVRVLTMEPDGRTVRERLCSYDGSGRRYSYEFAGEPPFPVRAYTGTVRALPVTETGATFVEWWGEFDCDSALVDRLTSTFTSIYREFLDDLRAHARGRAS
jgi:hypothetical protein